MSKGHKSYSSACAAAGQLGIMSLYETMFSQYDITISQVLVTAFDFHSPERRKNVQYVISQLLALGIVPLINENDAVSANQGYETFGDGFSDNDSLAAMVSVEMSAQLLVLLTDVKGLYDRPPSEVGAKIIDVFQDKTGFVVGEKSLQGRGGMSAKVDAALCAVRGGVQAVVIAAGHEIGVIDKVMRGESVGTIFLHDTLMSGATPTATAALIDGSDGSDKSAEVAPTVSVELKLEDLASGVRRGQQQLQSVSAQVRTDTLLHLAKLIHDKSEELLAANALDLEAAARNKLSLSLLGRLKLTAQKIQSIVEGIRSVAAQEDPIDKVRRTFGNFLYTKAAF